MVIERTSKTIDNDLGIKVENEQANSRGGDISRSLGLQPLGGNVKLSKAESPNWDLTN